MSQPPRRSKPLSGLLAALAVAGGLVMSSMPVAAATSVKSGVRAASASKAVGKASFVDSSSSEKPAAREKRLKRECRGRPNAGACLGHAS